MAGSYEAKAAAELLDAVEKRNPEALQAALQKQTFTFLDHQVRNALFSLKLRLSDFQKPSKFQEKPPTIVKRN